MKIKAYICVCACVVMYLFCAHAYSTNGEFIDITSNMHIDVYNNSFPLDQRIRCVAVDSCGNVAVRSGSSQDHCDYIISVYTKTGVFLYGYEITFKNQRGHGILFFDGEDRLCYSATFSSETVPAQNILIKFDSPSTGYTSYTLDEKNYVSDGAVEYMNNIPVFISERTQYTIAYCTEYSLGINDMQTNKSYVAYDQLAAYDIAVKRQTIVNISVAVLCTVIHRRCLLVHNRFHSSLVNIL